MSNKKKCNILYAAVLILFAHSFCFPLSAGSEQASLKARARQIHERAIVFDAHAHPWFYDHSTRGKFIFGKDTPYNPVNFPAMKKGGMDAVFIAIPSFSEAPMVAPVKTAMEGIHILRQTVEALPGMAEIALTAGDIHRIHKTGKRAVLLSMEYIDPLEGDLKNLRLYYRKGIRSITVMHGKRDAIAGENPKRPGHYILSGFGKGVIAEMNRLGMLIDITHVPDDLQSDIIKHSSAPVMISHSCVRALNPKARNVPDSIIKQLARKGGAIMIAFRSANLSAEFDKKQRSINEQLRKKGIEPGKEHIPPRVSVERLIDHIDHVVKAVGVKHVGIGSDFVEYTNPVGLENASGFPLITYHLLKRGYKDEDILKIMGGNLIRLLQQVEQSRGTADPK